MDRREQPTTTRPRRGTALGLAVAVIVAAAAWPAPGRGQASFPSTPPPTGAPRDFQVPEPKRFTLPNGLEVALVPWGNMPKVLVSLAVRGGRVFEGPKDVWLATLTGNLMREGTSTRTSAQISEQAARMGGSLNVGVGVDLASVGGDVLSEFGPQMVALVADVATHPKFPESELPRLKADLSRQLAVALSQPQQVALQKFRQILYPDHPFGRIFPTDEMIKGFTVDQVKSFYGSNFAAGRSRLYVVGRFDAAAVESAIKQHFAAWPRGEKPAPPPAKPTSARAIYMVDRPGAVQSTIMLGLPVIDPSNPDFIPFSVMDALLGGAFASRITRNIREDKGYTYSPNSEVSTRFRDAYWAENADVTTAHTGASLKEIFAEIERLQKEPPAADELKGIQNYLAGTFVLQNSSRSGIAGQLRYMDLHGLPPDYANQYVKRVYAATPDQISEVARKYLQSDRATIVIVGDRKAIEEQVKPFGKIVDLK